SGTEDVAVTRIGRLYDPIVRIGEKRIFIEVSASNKFDGRDCKAAFSYLRRERTASGILVVLRQPHENASAYLARFAPLIGIPTAVAQWHPDSSPSKLESTTLQLIDRVKRSDSISLAELRPLSTQ